MLWRGESSRLGHPNSLFFYFSRIGVVMFTEVLYCGRLSAGKWAKNGAVTVDCGEL